MMYRAYQAHQDFMAPFQVAARNTSALLRQFGGFAPIGPLNHLTAALDILGGYRTTHERLPFGILSIRVGDRDVAVREEVVHRGPFATLLRFAKDTDRAQPKLLVVAPMSGHFATLLRGTVAAALPDHDVYVTDWHNGRDVPLDAGRFGFDEFVAHVSDFLRRMGPGGHVMAVCQPAVPVLAAVALMSEDGDPATPRSMTLMGGPIDSRAAPTKVNELANSKPIEWFERNLVAEVPWRYAGAGRRVYPGAVQLTAFMSMNPDRHRKAYADQFQNLVRGDAESAEAHRRFYDEYLAVMDLPAEFYLETVSKVFQEHLLPRGELHVAGRLVRPEVIRDTALLAVEGERDDICAVGQTAAALTLCSGLKPAMKRHHVQGEVGHYGVFNGRRWTGEIYPVVREVIRANAA